MENSNYVLILLENHFEVIKFYFQERINSSQIPHSEFENICKNVFYQLNVNLRAQIHEKDFLYFCKVNKSRLLDIAKNV